MGAMTEPGAADLRAHHFIDIDREGMEGEVMSLHMRPKVLGGRNDNVVPCAFEAQCERNERLYVASRSRRKHRDPHPVI